MPLKTLKKDTTQALTLEWVLHVKNYKLTLDRKACVGCQVCSLACPKGAIKLEKQPKPESERAKRAKVDIDLAKCNFCGICDVLCPYGAVKVSVNGEHLLSVVEKESFPQLIRDIKINPSKVPVDFIESEACPLGLIKITPATADGTVVGDLESVPKKERKKLQAKVDVDIEHCPCCRVCEFKLPEGAMQVQKAFYGRLLIHPERCPEGCTDCLDVCPITGALYLSEEDKKVHENELFCGYCGACKAVCPVEDAMELKRTRIRHTPVRSGAWNKALGRVASPLEMAEELKAKGSRKVVESVSDRLKWKVT